MNFKSKKYNLCFGALYSLNGMLPEEFQVTISDILHKELMKQTVYCKCNNCFTEYKDASGKITTRPTEIESKTIRVYSVMNTSMISLVSGEQFDKRWDCPICLKPNRLSQTKYVKDIKKKPYYLKVVPEHPERKDGLMDRSTYHRKVGSYILTFLSEVEHQMGEYRRGYQPKDTQYNDIEGSENTNLDDLL